jgi:predicted transcriptional regulator
MITAMLWSIETGKVPPAVTLQGDAGGRVDGKAWHSTMLKDKVYVLFYVDPDEKDLNQPFVDALHARRFDQKRFGSVAIVNMAATWKPDAIIAMLLKKKQKKYPTTIYVKDKNKTLVKKWGLADDNFDVLIFDKKGRLIYKHFGKMDRKEIDKALALIEGAL